MIARKRIYEKAAPSRDAQKIYIFCEGERREKEYFDFFVGISSNLQIIPITPENSQSDPQKLMEQANRLFLVKNHPLDLDIQERDVVWFAIDTDDWGEEGKIKVLRSFCNDQNSNLRYSAWNVAESNPCLEIWLYYHIFEDKPDETEVSQYQSMKEFVDNKIRGGFDCSTMPAYIKSAIRNAENNYTASEDGPSLYSTEEYLLGKDIWKYAGPEIERKTNRFI